MQMSKAAELKNAWGDKPCSHPSFEKEYILGGQTGDYICSTCGETFMPDEYRRIKEERKKADEAKPDSSS